MQEGGRSNRISMPVSLAADYYSSIGSNNGRSTDAIEGCSDIIHVFVVARRS